jgi:hypothetical protein
VLAEHVDPAHIAPQRVERAMPRLVGHLEHRGARLGGARQEPRSQVLATLLFASRASETRPPSATARNTGPLLISAAASHGCTVAAGRRGGIATPALPFLVGLAAADPDTQPVLERSRVGPAEWL